METTRETKVIETPVSKQKVEVVTYLIGREKRALTNVFLTGDLNFSIETQEVKGINSAVLDQAQELAWSIVVKSIDGSTENITETILDMREEDYEFIVSTVNEIKGDADFSKKKTT